MSRPHYYAHYLTVAEVLPYLAEGMAITASEGCYMLPPEVMRRNPKGTYMIARRSFRALQNAGLIEYAPTQPSKHSHQWIPTEKAKQGGK